MNRKALIGTAVLLVIMLPACSSNEIKRAAYEATYHKGCIDRTGAQNCDPGHKTYEEYKKDREQLTKPDRQAPQ
jgi:hypothetical protein